MGTLETIGIISIEGKPTQPIIDSFRKSVGDFTAGGIEIGSTSVKPEETIGDFWTLDIARHKEKYPSWHGYYIDGLLTSVAGSLDKIPDTGILMPIGVFDPTKPIALILSKLKGLFDGLGIDEAFLIANLGKILENAEALGKGLQSIIKNLSADATAAIEEFFETLNKALSNKLDDIDKEEKADILSAIEDVAKEIEEMMKLPIPDIPIPVLDLSFILPEIDLSPLFFTKEIQGVDGIATKFIKTMTAFISIPVELMNKIADLISGDLKEAADAIKKIADAIALLLSDIETAVKELLSALIGFVWDIISNILSISQIAVLEIASTLSVVIFFVKCFIVSLIGFILGSGLIAKSVAQLLELI